MRSQLDKRSPYLNPSPASDLVLLSTSGSEEDSWCLDYRGLLTLCLCKDTYQTLGLVGKKLAFSKALAERYGESFAIYSLVAQKHLSSIVIHLPLRQTSESAANRARRDAALKAWDAARERNGSDPWPILCTFKGS